MRPLKLILLLMLVFSLESNAHQPDVSSTLLVEQSDDKWVLQIRAALTAFEYEIAHHFGELSFASPEEFQELLIQHVQERTSIKFNDNIHSSLQNGKVQLGHETSVTFDVSGISQTTQSISITNTSFSEIPRNQSALMVIKKGLAREQFTLDSTNDHTAKLIVSDSKVVLMASNDTRTAYSFYVLGAVFLILSFVFFSFRKYKVIKPDFQLQNRIINI